MSSPLRYKVRGSVNLNGGRLLCAATKYPRDAIAVCLLHRGCVIQYNDRIVFRGDDWDGNGYQAALLTMEANIDKHYADYRAKYPLPEGS